MSQGDDECKTALVKAGWPAELARLLALDKGKQIEMAANTIGHLLKGCMDVKQRVVDAGVVPLLMKHLRSSTGKIRRGARYALSSIHEARESLTGLGEAAGVEIGAILEAVK